MNNRTKLVIAILVILNLVLMTFLYLGKPNRPMHNSPKELIIEKLEFDDNQIQEFESLILEHQESSKLILDEIKENKITLYKEMANEDAVFNDSIIKTIGTKFEELEQAHYNHFLGIKKICNEQQQEKYGELLSEFQTIFSPKNRRPKRK